tara:strand:- start:8002 stop:8676 length:675 start_codon:yes stop_codon:yes gene_type:complete
MEALDNDKLLELIYNTPIALSAIKDKKILEAIDSYLPYSCGMEFECSQKEGYDEEIFGRIPDIMEVNIDMYEQRYRIPNGLKGMICLYEICRQMKINSYLALESSNHYHTDLTDIWKEVNTDNFDRDNNNWIIEELTTWGTAFQQSNGWYKYNYLGTLEIRIGEPTFEYNIIIKRLIQCCDINRKIRNISKGYNLESITKQLSDMRNIPVEEVLPQVNKRIIRL